MQATITLFFWLLLLQRPFLFFAPPPRPFQPLDPSLLDRMRRCLVTELRTLLRLSGVGEGRVQTVFFGGGTPSLMRPDDVEVGEGGICQRLKLTLPKRVCTYVTRLCLRR